MQRRDPAEAELMSPLFDKYVAHLLEYIRVNLHPVMHNEQVLVVVPEQLVLMRGGPHLPPLTVLWRATSVSS